MAKPKTIYACQTCGAQSPKWLGRCPECDAWNSYVEETNIEAKRSLLPETISMALPLAEIQSDEGHHIPTGIEEFDRVLGGGYVPGSMILIGGDPGIGKSTIMMQAFSRIASKGKKLLYISGEESASQIKLRADRMNVSEKSFYVVAENCLERVVEQIKKLKPDVIAIDSIQTIYTNDIQSAPGTVSQVRECAAKLLMLCKGSNIACFLVGHVTKEGAIAGPKVLEHMVDAVLYFEGERGHAYRILRTMKNRFGSTNEIGVFEMTGQGLMEVKNPSDIFLAERPHASAGSVVVSSLEGSRPVLLEIQALVSSSPLANPRRTSLGIDSQRVNLLVAVLEKIVGLQLYDHDIFVNVAGGIRITEPASDLGVMAAIASSFKNKPINHTTILIGEVGLTGEVRAVMGIEARLKEAQKMGFTKAVIPSSNLKSKFSSKLEVMGVTNVEACLELL
ncbi:MAG: DNA repair protein RadA [Deltaproteobacteria bacterium RIFCSPLOWO2_02_FULL_44_10]|nr:MAG: DNA repair protein RadA [Deltaproteobacteria bacterium RIFCSPHIGHO2_02_FULL_44_16]OGQ46436.1 MAG: DNA repair protein RadA [Deltaproteobacteria bacterium RIFCSPLOWO2_02_FULL_44_10]